MNPRLNQNKTELGVLVLSVGLQVLADGNRLFDEVPKVLRDGWAKSYPVNKKVYPKSKGACKKAAKEFRKSNKATHEFFKATK